MGGTEGAGTADRGHDDPLAYRDPEFIRRRIPDVERYIAYFTPEVRGLGNLPATGPVLLVGNHSCLFWMPDAWVVARAIVERRGVEQGTYALGYDLLFGVPGVGPFIRRLGAIPASGHVAERALAGGALVLVYPGGDREASRPWRDRNRIDFGGRSGFVRLALRAGVPVVPVVAHGSHDAIVVLSRGEGIARALGLDRLRIKVFPIFLGPLGVTTIFRPPPPVPSSITVEFLSPLDWSHHGETAADDPGVVGACYREITGVMQAALTRLAAEHPHPLLRGIGRLVAGVPGRLAPRRPGRAGGPARQS